MARTLRGYREEHPEFALFLYQVAARLPLMPTNEVEIRMVELGHQLSERLYEQPSSLSYDDQICGAVADEDAPRDIAARLWNNYVQSRWAAYGIVRSAFVGHMLVIIPGGAFMVLSRECPVWHAFPPLLSVLAGALCLLGWQLGHTEPYSNKGRLWREILPVARQAFIGIAIAGVTFNLIGNAWVERIMYPVPPGMPLIAVDGPPFMVIAPGVFRWMPGWALTGVLSAIVLLTASTLASRHVYQARLAKATYIVRFELIVKKLLEA